MLAGGLGDRVAAGLTGSIGGRERDRLLLRRGAVAQSGLEVDQAGADLMRLAGARDVGAADAIGQRI